MRNFAEKKENRVNKVSLLTSQGSGDDTTAPVIVFIQPLSNNTLITTSSYTIIANISDENPPLYGNVTLSISNQTNFLFNVTMEYESEFLWSYNWDNISAYPNLEDYIIQVWAKDSSSTENLGKSEDFYVYVSISRAPGILSIVLYLIAVSIIFAGIVVYLNKKILPKASKKKREKTKGLFDD